MDRDWRILSAGRQEVELAKFHVGSGSVLQSPVSAARHKWIFSGDEKYEARFVGIVVYNVLHGCCGDFI